MGAVSIGTGAIADGISRAYDSLIENAVRTTESDLVSKESMIEYTNKLIDFLGDEKASLTPALSNFFDSIRSLATDASSAVQRDQLLASGNSRLKSLHLSTIEREVCRLRVFEEVSH